MEIKPIKTEADYNKALARAEVLMDAPNRSKLADELEVLSILIERYEEEKWPMDLPDPVEAIKYRMEQLGYGTSDLQKILGHRSRVSEILNRRRKLSLQMIRCLRTELHIPSDALIGDYALARSRKSTRKTVRRK